MQGIRVELWLIMPRKKPNNPMTPYRARNNRLRDMGFESYQEYLASDEWKRIREEVLRRDNWTCVACGGKATCVHHGNYSGAALSGNTASMVSLCHPCHKFIEFSKNGAKLHPTAVRDRLAALLRRNGRAIPGKCQKCFGPKRKHFDFCRKCMKRITEDEYNGTKPREA